MTIREINRALKELKKDEPIYYLKHNKTNTYVKGFHYNRLLIPISPEVKYFNKLTGEYVERRDYDKLNLYGEYFEPTSISLFVKDDKHCFYFSEYNLKEVTGCKIKNGDEKLVASILKKEYNKRKKLLKDEIFFLPDNVREKFEKLNFAKMQKEELEDFILKVATKQAPEFRYLQICVMRAKELENANFQRNPVSLLSLYFQESETFSKYRPPPEIITRIRNGKSFIKM